jgi:phosphate uptake regulator
MAGPERQQLAEIARAERAILDALAGIEALLASAVPDRGGSGLRMIVAERQVRELARVARDDLLDLLAHGSLQVTDQRLAVTLLHTSHVVCTMCDEYVDLSRLDGLPAPDDSRIAAALDSMRDLSRGQIRTATQALADRDDALASGLHPVHATIEALNHEVGDQGLVAEDGAVGREALGSAVLAAECLTRVSEQAVDVGEHVIVLARGPSSARQSPV